jgi:NADH:ubiquinone oxidoreductase subunit F (NADH-binding)
MSDFLLRPYKTESALAHGMRQSAETVRASAALLPAAAEVLIVDGREYGEGAFALRTLMEAHLDAVLDGLILAGYATGAAIGYVFVSGRYPLIWRNLQTIIRDRREMGMLGARLFGTRFSFDIEARIDILGPGERGLLLSQLAGKLLPDNSEGFAGTVVMRLQDVIRLAQGWADGAPDTIPAPRLVAVSGAVDTPGVFEWAEGASLAGLIGQAGGDPDGTVRIGGSEEILSVAALDSTAPSDDPLNLIVMS